MRGKTIAAGVVASITTRATGTHGYLAAAAPAKPPAIDFTSEFHADCDADTLEITEFMML